MVGQVDREQRIFAWALAASVVLHAVVLALRMPEFSGPAEFAAPAIVAHIVRVEPVEPAAAEVSPPKPEVSPPKPKVEKPKPKAIEKQVPITARAPQPQTPSPIPAPAPPPVASAPPASEPASAAAPVAEAPRVASAPAAQAAAPDTMNVGRYRQLLINEARRYNDYPPRAQDNGWEGDVSVRIAISANGQVSEIKVQQTSGHGVLDDQALKTLRAAAQRVPVPAALRGQAFAIEVRMIYQLKN